MHSTASGLSEKRFLFERRKEYTGMPLLSASLTNCLVYSLVLPQTNNSRVIPELLLPRTAVEGAGILGVGLRTLSIAPKNSAPPATNICAWRRCAHSWTSAEVETSPRTIPDA